VIELWGGLECTVNRVGDVYHDQLERLGHDRRLGDLDRVRALGITTLRFPILWERTAPAGLETADWRWPDAMMDRLRALGIRPIVGLVHHGSGPPHTSLLDPAFPDRLATFARAVAERYPWVRHFTPINEPLTTARFSALYGHWYPHTTDAESFGRALLVQALATARAMRAIRAVIPRAALVQTEDLAFVHGTPALAEQARFENERRWLTYDLLTGRVDARHELGRYLRGVGVPTAWLDELVREPVPPDLLGLNYYVTSERYLDENLAGYPVSSHGGNGRLRYADVEAVRVRPEGLLGLGALARQAWQRYRLPLAVTEAHLAGPSDDQVRWLHEIWREARQCREAGVDLRAVTAWALFGAYDWHNLVTRREDRYEPGAFDVRSGQPSRTELGRLVAELASRRESTRPGDVLPGWWRHTDRLYDRRVS
jgi:dTDP-4-dehydrorhamnose reductase